MSSARTDSQVFISGAGPVGLCLALLLARAGVDVCVCEAEPTISEDLRASTFHPPTLDLLEPLGVTATLLEQGLICPHWQIRLHPTGERAVFDLSVLAGDTGHPYRLQVEQWKLSRALLDALRAEPRAEVTLGAPVVGMSQDNDCVAIEIERDGRRETHRALIAVGADGARSFIRRALDIPFEGETYPEITLLLTPRVPFEDHLEGVSNVT